MYRRSVLVALVRLCWVGFGTVASRQISIAPKVLRLSKFGVLPTGSPMANDVAMRKALQAAAKVNGAQLIFDAGEYRFSVARPWAIGAHTRLIGAGKRRTILKRLDRSTSNWIEAKNSEGQNFFSGFTAVGNSQSQVHGDGAFLLCEIDSAAKRDYSGLSFSDVELQNFRGAGWIFVLMRGACRFNIHDVRIDGSCSFVSRPGNARGSNDIGVLAAAILVQGNVDPSGSAGRIRGVKVGNANADIPHIKSFCVIWGGVANVGILRPTIERCGTIGISPDSGAYAIMVGNETIGAPNPDQVDILGPTIKACQSVGVYFVNWGGKGGICRFDGSGGSIANVTDTMNGTLPKGAVTATDGQTRLEIRNVRAINCVSAVDIPLANKASVLIDGVYAEGVPVNQYAIRVGMQGGLPTNEPAAGIEIRNVHVRSTAPFVTGIKFATARNMGNVKLGGVIDIDVPYIGISAFAETGEMAVDPFDQFLWDGKATFANCIAGAVVVRDNVSAMDIRAEIIIKRGSRRGMRDTRFKADNAVALSLSGSVSIDDVRHGDHPAWSAQMAGERHTGHIKAGAVRFSNAVRSIRGSDGSVGLEP